MGDKMGKVKVILDSTAYLPDEYLQKLSIDIIPLHVIWGDEIYRDGVDISEEEFYGRLPDAKVMPTTSQPSPKEFTDLFQKYLAQGYDILSIHISSKLSGTVDSANQAKEMLGVKNIEVIDSMFTIIGTGFQAIAAARASMDGASLAECAEIAKKIRSNTRIYFLPGTLEYLRRGGRIGGAAALLGSALDLKPILTVQEGRIAAYEKVRTMKKAISRMVDIFEEQIGDKRPFYIGVSQALAAESAAILKNEILKKFSANDFVDFLESGLSPVIGSHVGPGTVALSFCPAD